MRFTWKRRKWPSSLSFAWASYGVFVKTDDARTMLGCRTPFSFGLCIPLKLSPALNLFLQHKLPTNCSSLPKHSPPITGQLSNYMPQLGSNLRLSQLHPLRPNHIDQSQGSKLSKTEHRKTTDHIPQTDKQTSRLVDKAVPYEKTERKTDQSFFTYL